VLHVDRSARAEVDAPIERCLEVLGAVERYPTWARLLAEAAWTDFPRVRLRAAVVGLSVVMDCELSISEDGAELRRIPYSDDDAETYVGTWSVGDGSVELHVRAEFEAPGPASLLRGRVGKALVDDLLDDFCREVDS
jgi:hypothetical protein